MKPPLPSHLVQKARRHARKVAAEYCVHWPPRGSQIPILFCHGCSFADGEKNCRSEKVASPCVVYGEAYKGFLSDFFRHRRKE